MKKGFISILASLVILAVGFGAAYQYSKTLKSELDENIVLVSQKVDKLGGSLVATRYGGTGTSTNAWSGLLRLTSGVWATTTLADADVPDNITVTGITSLSLTSLTSASSTFNNTTTFTGIPVLPASDPTTDNQATRKVYVDTLVSNLASSTFATTTSPSRALGTYYQNTSGKTLIVNAVVYLSSPSNGYTYDQGQIGNATPTTQVISQLGSNAERTRSFDGTIIMFVPNGYYYAIIETNGGASAGDSSLVTWTETTSN